MKFPFHCIYHHDSCRSDHCLYLTLNCVEEVGVVHWALTIEFSTFNDSSPLAGRSKCELVVLKKAILVLIEYDFATVVSWIPVSSIGALHLDFEYVSLCAS